MMVICRHIKSYFEKKDECHKEEKSSTSSWNPEREESSLMDTDFENEEKKDEKKMKKVNKENLNLGDQKDRENEERREEDVKPM